MTKEIKPPWLIVAEKELGQDEIPGDRHNPRIIEYGKAVDLHFSDDETPWCSTYVNWCFYKVGIIGSRQANARSWMSWGIPLAEPLLGCVPVFKRGDSTWKGHVGFYIDETYDPDGPLDFIKVLGGNQSNTVRCSWYRKSDLLGYRWPKEIENV